MPSNSVLAELLGLNIRSCQVALIAAKEGLSQEEATKWLLEAWRTEQRMQLWQDLHGQNHGQVDPRGPRPHNPLGKSAGTTYSRF